jgi:acidic leucine-rich nuclear phosphoprotein 32 family protein A/C/D
MEKRIALEKRGRPEDQITELNLDNCKSTTVEGLTDKFTALESLSLINVGLVTLKNFPALPALKRLELSDNRISNGLNHITNCPALTNLNLSGNRIKELEDIRPLSALTKLEVLDLFNNDITNVERYREKMFEILPNLKYLDGFDKNDVEAPSDAEDEENGNDSEEEYDDDDDEVSLAEVYNDDLEDDENDWDGKEEEEEDDDIEDDEEGEDGAEKPNESTEDAAGESDSKGKKRKHDDE